MIKDVILVILFVVAFAVFVFVVVKMLNPGPSAPGRKTISRQGVVLDVDESSKVKILQAGNRMNIQINTALPAGSVAGATGRLEPVEAAPDGIDFGDMLNADPLDERDPGVGIDAKWWEIARTVAATEELEKKRELAEFFLSQGLITKDMAQGILEEPEDEEKKESKEDAPETGKELSGEQGDNESGEQGTDGADDPAATAEPEMTGFDDNTVRSPEEQNAPDAPEEATADGDDPYGFSSQFPKQPDAEKIPVGDDAY